MLALMISSLAVVVGWFGALKPLERARDAAIERRSEASAQLAIVDAAVEAASSVPASSGDMQAAVISSAARQGLALDGHSLQGPGVLAVRLGGAEPSAFFAWARELAAQGIAISNLTASSRGDGTAQFEVVFSRS